MSKDYSTVIRNIIGSGWTEMDAPSYARDLKIGILPGKVTVCIGVRRCGKSTFLMQQMKKMVDEGLPKENIVCVNFADDRLADMTVSDLEQVVGTYYAQFPEKQNEHVCFLFDEIQEVDGWEKFVDRLRHTQQADIFVTGSSAKLLSGEIGTQMRGRSLTWELFPFSFGEYAAAKGVPRDGSADFTAPMELKKAWADYRKQGGFPEVMDIPDHLRVAVLQEYYNTLLYRDVIERHKCRNTKLVRVFLNRLANQAGCLVSFAKMQRDLSSAGHATTRETLTEIFSWLEDAYFLSGVSKYSASMAEQGRSAKKLYLIDHALTEALGSGSSPNKGHVLENIVYLALRRHTKNVYYYTTRAEHEVDFMARGQDGTTCLVQVCEEMTDEATRKRELRALGEGMAELGLREGWVVTEDTQEDIPLPEGIVHCVPARYFLLPVVPPCMVG